ncbi:MAG: DNA repair protein RadC [Alphaproteobacteria bacterium]|jgi:DNA repair protein RadC
MTKKQRPLKEEGALLDMLVGGTDDDKNESGACEPHYLGHRERLRQKLLALGGEALPDYELMELVLMQAIPRKDVKPLAKEIIRVFGSFAGALTAEPEELRKVNGVKDATIALFAVIREAAVRMLKNQASEAPVINNWEAIVSYCRAAMGRRKIEVFRVLFLDSKNRLIRDEVLQEGTVNQTMIYPREIAKRALELSAVSLIMVHNHPAGDLKPSKNDVIMTKAVEDALRTINVTLLDHLIVAKSGYVSFKERGYLKSPLHRSAAQ